MYICWLTWLVFYWRDVFDKVARNLGRVQTAHFSLQNCYQLMHELKIWGIRVEDLSHLCKLHLHKFTQELLQCIDALSSNLRVLLTLCKQWWGLLLNRCRVWISNDFVCICLRELSNLVDKFLKCNFYYFTYYFLITGHERTFNKPSLSWNLLNLFINIYSRVLITKNLTRESSNCIIKISCENKCQILFEYWKPQCFKIYQSTFFLNLVN